MLGDKIKELRKSKNMYQQDLADALSVSKSTVAMWETNKRIPDTTMLVKIADYFDITVDYLLEEERRILAIQKHGFCYDNEEREKIKADSRNKISSGTLSDAAHAATEAAAVHRRYRHNHSVVIICECHIGLLSPRSYLGKRSHP